MGNKINNNNNNNINVPSLSSQSTIRRQNSTVKEVHITTDHVDGFYFSGERLTGTVKIPRSFLHRHSSSIKIRKPAESLHKRSLRSAIMMELVGDANYSTDLDPAADSDGHVTHKVNICRERCLVTISHVKTELDATVHASPSSESISLPIIPPPPIINGTFQLNIPDGLPPSLTNNRLPSVVYTLELSLSSSRCRYQIPITICPRSSIPHPMTSIELSDHAINRNDIHLRASILGNFYRPGEEIPVRITYSNPQQRLIRSITVRLIQFYRIHNDENRLQIDGKEWIFDAVTTLSQYEWTGEAHLHLFDQHLQTSYATHYVGTTQTIECEVQYRIIIELNEKKGDDIHLTLAPIEVTYQK
ncbi:unnamed protein product [Adineta steineri]|uniref:Arrestin C-terminal-like domain-containing protein n=1 Tax=Adineta steineri TaxID=433720 RepID=A0A814ZQT8_9BILA|nr:unnamed protein product [Adineta steineri]CAF1245125.1 unnamed protein product [Adineta steineri]